MKNFQLSTRIASPKNSNRILFQPLEITTMESLTGSSRSGEDEAEDSIILDYEAIKINYSHHPTSSWS